MADDKSNAGGRDRTRIDVNQDYELRDWSKKFGVSPEELKAAVKAVGSESNAVEQHLRGRAKHPT
jgi:hypothetical protein